MVVYLHGDHLGSTSLTTCGSAGGCGEVPLGGVVARQLYHPYGTVRYSEGELPTDLTFTGQRDVAGTGLMHYGARYYHPALGRFVSADTIVPDPANPQGLNRFSYVLGNPLGFVDPSGHFDLKPPTADGICTGNGDCNSALSKGTVRGTVEPGVRAGRSGVGGYVGGAVGADLLGGVEGSLQIMGVLNWNSWELTYAPTIGKAVTASPIPNVASGQFSIGSLVPMHYSDNSMIVGVSQALSVSAEAEAVATLGGEIGKSWEMEAQRNWRGEIELVPAIDRGGTNRQPYTRNYGLSAGASLVPTGGDLTVSREVSCTPIALTIELNPANWRRDRFLHIELDLDSLVDWWNTPLLP